MCYDFDYLERNHYNGDTFLVRNFLGNDLQIRLPHVTADNFDTLREALVQQREVLEKVRRHFPSAHSEKDAR